MKVSSRGGGLSGCGICGLLAAPWPLRAAAAGGRLWPSRAACGPSVPGRCAVARPPRRLGPSRLGYLGAREGATAELWPGRARAVSPLGKFPHYRCQLTKALMSLRLLRLAGKVWGGGVRGRSFSPQSEPSTLRPPCLIFRVLPRPLLPANFH